MGYEFGDLTDLLDMNSLGQRLTNFLNEYTDLQLDCRGDGSAGRGWSDWNALTLIFGEASATIAEETAWNIDTFCIVWARLDTGTALIHISRTSSTHARWGDPKLGAVAEGVALGIDGTNLLDRITVLVIAWTGRCRSWRCLDWSADSPIACVAIVTRAFEATHGVGA